MDEQVIGLLIFISILVVGYVCFYPYIRGPVADMTINTRIDPTGNISYYSIDLQFGDDMSYSNFLSDAKGKDLSVYELRATTAPNMFTITNDSANRKITITAIGPFDPNSATSFMHVIKTQNYWEFDDGSINSSSFLPGNYINKLTYTLTIPSDIIDATTLDNSSVWFSNEKQLTWTMDQDKNWFNPKGDNLDPPRIYVKFQVPEPSSFPWAGIGITAAVAVILGFVLLRRSRY